MADAQIPNDAPLIKAIETTYAGHRFRSRLEARWAVFFDALGWSWKYEQEGYEIGYFERHAWLPDFEISVGGQDFYVEVKGDPNFFADGEWLEHFDFTGGPPGFQDSLFARDKGGKPLIVLGNLPREKTGWLFVPVISHYKGVVLTWDILRPSGLVKTDDVFCLSDPSHMAEFQPIIKKRPGVEKPLMDALAKARAARFEHGEKP